MLNILVILGTIIAMAISSPDIVTPSRDEIMSTIMQQYRSEEIRTSTRNGFTMLNPYHFHHEDNAEEHQKLAVSLLDQVYTSPVEEQASVAKQLGVDNDKAGPYMIWDAFVTGHADIYRALSGSFLTSADPSHFDRVVDRYMSGRIKEVLNATAETKLETNKAWLDEFPQDASELLWSAAKEGDVAVLNYMIDADYASHPETDPTIVPLHEAC